VEEWLVNTVTAMFEGAQTVVRMGEGDRKAFYVKVGLHQRSVLSPLRFEVVVVQWRSLLRSYGNVCILSAKMCP